MMRGFGFVSFFYSVNALRISRATLSDEIISQFIEDNNLSKLDEVHKKLVVDLVNNLGVDKAVEQLFFFGGMQKSHLKDTKEAQCEQVTNAYNAWQKGLGDLQNQNAKLKQSVLDLQGIAFDEDVPQWQHFGADMINYPFDDQGYAV